MSFKKRELRLLKAEAHVAELRELLGSGYEVKRYSPYHYRIFGGTVIDYWPTKNKAWVTGSDKKSVAVSPHDVAVLAQGAPITDWRTDEQRAQLEHMRNL